MPRPAEKDRGFVRTVRFEVRIRPAERKRWAERATKEGMPLSEWLRMVANRAARVG